MSDPLQPAPSPASQAPDPLRATESYLNPQDMALKSARGEIRPDTTVREFLEGMGIDIEGPVSQFNEAMQKQVSNASTPGKMQSMAAMAPQQAPAAPQGLGSLMGGTQNGRQSSASRIGQGY